MAQTSATIDPRTGRVRFRVAALPGYRLEEHGGYAAVLAPGGALPAGQVHQVDVPLVAPGGGAPPVAPAPAPVAPAPAPAAAATPAQTDAARAARLLRFGGDRSNPIE